MRPRIKAIYMVISGVMSKADGGTRSVIGRGYGQSMCDVQVEGRGDAEPTLSHAKKYSASPYHLTGQKLINTIAAQNTDIPTAGVSVGSQKPMRVVAAD